jgi:hypothetical protein
MAKQAKQVERELPDSVVNKSVKEILDHYETIESERGKFMLKARREREGMTGVYESMAQRGVAQKVMKTEIKIIRALAKIKGWMADLEADERKQLQQLAKAQKDKQQLTLFGDLPKAEKPPKKGKPQLELVEPTAVAAE